MIEDFRIRVFDTVARMGNFTKAARELGISQPAVSNNIMELEKEAGEPLFFRTKNGVSLTPKGEEFRRCTDQILYWYDVAGKVLDGSAPLKTVPVTFRIEEQDLEVEVSESLGRLSLRVLK